MTNLIVPFLKSPLGDPIAIGLGVKLKRRTKISKNKFQMTKTFTDNTRTC